MNLAPQNTPERPLCDRPGWEVYNLTDNKLLEKASRASEMVFYLWREAQVVAYDTGTSPEKVMDWLVALHVRQEAELARFWNP